MGDLLEKGKSVQKHWNGNKGRGIQYLYLGRIIGHSLWGQGIDADDIGMLYQLTDKEGGCASGWTLDRSCTKGSWIIWDQGTNIGRRIVSRWVGHRWWGSMVFECRVMKLCYKEELQLPLMLNLESLVRIDCRMEGLVGLLVHLLGLPHWDIYLWFSSMKNSDKNGKEKLEKMNISS